MRRRVLVNYRIDADIMRSFLPASFVPKLHAGYAIGGICLIRLEHIRPLAIDRVVSSFFDDQTTFPPDRIAFDHALVTRDIAHEWHGVGDKLTR